MKKLLSALAAASLVAIMMTSGALASHATGNVPTVAPESISHAPTPGNPQCGAAPAGGFSLKIEDDDLAVGNFGPINITAFDGTYISWEIDEAFLHTYDANLVIVKGGPNAITYQYGTLEDWDTNLTAPKNPRNGKFFGVSHIDFCFDPKA